jgi:hypothetical protein
VAAPRQLRAGKAGNAKRLGQATRARGDGQHARPSRRISKRATLHAEMHAGTRFPYFDWMRKATSGELLLRSKESISPENIEASWRMVQQAQGRRTGRCARTNTAPAWE